MGPEQARALARSCSSPKAKAQVTDDVVSNKHSRVETLTLLSKSCCFFYLKNFTKCFLQKAAKFLSKVSTRQHPTYLPT